jgi:hypothetical protein
MSFVATGGPCIIRTPDGIEHSLTCRLTVSGDNPYAAFAGSVDGMLGVWEWPQLVERRLRFGFEEHDYWVRVLAARTASAWVERDGYIGTRRLFVL